VITGVIVVGGVLSHFLYRPSHRSTSPLESEKSSKANVSSSFYNDLAKIYNSGGGTRTDDSDSRYTTPPRNNSFSKISQYSPFVDEDEESLPLLKTRSSRMGAGSPSKKGKSRDSDSSADTVPVLVASVQANKTNNYETI